MKCFFLPLISLLPLGLIQAQPPLGDRIPEKMNLFIQKRMRMTQEEREAFGPIFARYQKEWRETLVKNRKDKLLARHQLIELQLKYRKEFSPIVGENRAIQIYDLQEDFINILRDVQEERLRGRSGPRKMGPPPPARRF
ncbi:MAG: hypothetical protein FJY16_06010 [Bacteroidetes bacterium]|nr:hypothetical protein [Bacteroidota bacterium]